MSIASIRRRWSSVQKLFLKRKNAFDQPFNGYSNTTQGIINSQSRLCLYPICPRVVYGQACLNPVFRYMASIAAPNSVFTAIDSNINGQGLNSAAVHGVVKCHPLCASHPRAVEPCLLIIFTRKWRLNVNIWAITYRKLLLMKSLENNGSFNSVWILSVVVTGSTIVSGKVHWIQQSDVAINLNKKVKGAQSRQFEIFWPRKKMHLNCRRSDKVVY